MFRMNESRMRKNRKWIAFGASAVTVVALTVISASAYYSPYSYVSLDVNPSIEYSVNRFDRVISAKAVNDDGEEIMQSLKLKNMSIDSAIQATVQQIAAEGYIPESETGGIVITTSCDNETKSAKLAAQLQTQAQDTVQAKGLVAEVEAESVSQERVEGARAMGVTPGKLNLVEKLQASAADESIDIQEWLNQPVKDIMKAIKENNNTSGNTQAGNADTDKTGAANSGNNATASNENCSGNGQSGNGSSENGNAKSSNAQNTSATNGSQSKLGTTATNQVKQQSQEQIKQQTQESQQSQGEQQAQVNQEAQVTQQEQVEQQENTTTKATDATGSCNAGSSGYSDANAKYGRN